MIRYSLKCVAGHRFDSWFQNAAAFGTLQAAGQLVCPVCNSAEVDKDLMTPKLATARQTDSPAPRAEDPASNLAAPGLREPASELEAAIAALRRHIAENSEYVGMNFASEARRMHDGTTPARPIHGEARPEEARQMLEDGLPVAPLPFLPPRKVN